MFEIRTDMQEISRSQHMQNHCKSFSCWVAVQKTIRPDRSIAAHQRRVTCGTTTFSGYDRVWLPPTIRHQVRCTYGRVSTFQSSRNLRFGWVSGVCSFTKLIYQWSHTMKSVCVCVWVIWLENHMAEILSFLRTANMHDMHYQKTSYSSINVSASHI